MRFLLRVTRRRARGPVDVQWCRRGSDYCRWLRDLRAWLSSPCGRAGRRRDAQGAAPIGMALTVFGLLFALSTTYGRAWGGPGAASASRYTTYDLMILVGAYLTYIGHSAQRRPRAADPSHAVSRLLGRTLGCLIALVAAFGIINGIRWAKSSDFRPTVAGSRHDRHRSHRWATRPVFARARDTGGTAARRCSGAGDPWTEPLLGPTSRCEVPPCCRHRNCRGVVQVHATSCRNSRDPVEGLGADGEDPARGDSGLGSAPVRVDFVLNGGTSDNEYSSRKTRLSDGPHAGTPRRCRTAPTSSGASSTADLEW